MSSAATPADPSPLGLPESGPGSIASLSKRIGALLIDWAASMIVAIGLFGVGVLRDAGWRQFMIMAVFYVETTVLTAFAGGSFGHLLSRMRVIRLREPARPVGMVAALRQLLVCLVIPALVTGPDRRGLHDTVCGTVLVNKPTMGAGEAQ